MNNGKKTKLNELWKHLVERDHCEIDVGRRYVEMDAIDDAIWQEVKAPPKNVPYGPAQLPGLELMKRSIIRTVLKKAAAPRASRKSSRHAGLVREDTVVNTYGPRPIEDFNISVWKSE